MSKGQQRKVFTMKSRINTALPLFSSFNYVEYEQSRKNLSKFHQLHSDYGMSTIYNVLSPWGSIPYKTLCIFEFLEWQTGNKKRERLLPPSIIESYNRFSITGSIKNLLLQQIKFIYIWSIAFVQFSTLIFFVIFVISPVFVGYIKQQRVSSHPYPGNTKK
jgi:hypothetical protein